MTKTLHARMHVSLNVGGIEPAVAFYSALFGVGPTKQRGDYAKFTLDGPGLVLSLNLAPRACGAADTPAGVSQLSHLGIQVASDAELDAVRTRIQEAGLRIGLEEPGVTCCYAVQNKFWITDPDGNSWEFYSFLEDADVHSVGSPAAGDDVRASESPCCPTDTPPSSGGAGCC